MKKETIVRLLWISVAVSAASIFIMVIITIYQGRIIDILTPSTATIIQDEFSIPYSLFMIAGFTILLQLLFVLLVQHGIKTGSKSIMAEVIACVVYSGPLIIISYVVNTAFLMSLSKHGAIGIVSVATLNSILSHLCDPISAAANCLFLIGIGMSIFYKKTIINRDMLEQTQTE